MRWIRYARILKRRRGCLKKTISCRVHSRSPNSLTVSVYLGNAMQHEYRDDIDSHHRVTSQFLILGTRVLVLKQKMCTLGRDGRQLTHQVSSVGSKRASVSSAMPSPSLAMPSALYLPHVQACGQAEAQEGAHAARGLLLHCNTAATPPQSPPPLRSCASVFAHANKNALHHTCQSVAASTAGMMYKGLHAVLGALLANALDRTLHVRNCRNSLPPALARGSTSTARIHAAKPLEHSMRSVGEPPMQFTAVGVEMCRLFESARREAYETVAFQKTKTKQNGPWLTHCCTLHRVCHAAKQSFEAHTMT